MSLLSPQLQAFMAIVDNNTVHAAAQALNLTQTAVTQRLKTLEARLHTTLFIRSKRGMNLTEEGQALLRYCHAALELEGASLAKIQGAGIETTIQLTITGPTSLMSSRVIKQCFPVMHQFPNLLMNYHISDRDNHDATLRAGHAQLAILEPEQISKDVQYKALKPEEYILVGPTNWKGKPLKSIIQHQRIIDFNPQDQYTFNYLKQYHLYEYANLERHFVNRTEDVVLMIQAGFGYSILTKEFAAPFINNKTLCVLNGGKTYLHEPYLAWYERPEPPRYFQALIQAIR